MSTKIYRFALGFFLLLVGVALAALMHAWEESLLYSAGYTRSQDLYPTIAVLLIGSIGAAVFAILKKRKSKTH